MISVVEIVVLLVIVMFRFVISFSRIVIWAWRASIDPAEVAAALAYLSAGKLNVATSGPAEPLTYNQTQ